MHIITKLQKDDFILPLFRKKRKGHFFNFLNFKIKDPTFPDAIRKIIEPDRAGMSTGEQKMDLKKKVSEVFFNQRKKWHKKDHFSIIDQLNLFQESYFLCNRSNVIKRTFINEIDKLLPIYWAESFLGETEKEKIDLITRKILRPLFIEKMSKKRS